MRDQWSLVDRSCSKRSSEECAGSFPKRQRRAQSVLEEAAEWEDVARIRGGLSRPRPPPLGPPPNRATNSGSQGNTANPPESVPAPPSSGSPSYIVEEGVDYVETWRIEAAQQNTTTTKQAGSTVTTTTGTVRQFPTDQELLDLFDGLQKIVTLWVEECLPDVFPPEFKTNKPERYWELCGWTRPMSLGNTLLQNRSWAKYVYESWVWRLLYQEIFQADSLAWAGFDAPTASGGLGGVGRTTNEQFGFLKAGQQKIGHDEYRNRIRSRAAMMRRVREEEAVTKDRKIKTTGWLVEEMLVAFHPYFPDEYQPIDHPENIEVLIRDTKFLIVKAQELDHKLRSAQHAYEMILGKEGDVVRISGVPSPKIQSYSNSPNGVRDLHDDDYIALIVVPGLVKNVVQEPAGAGPQLDKVVRRHAKAFTQTDLFDAIRAS